jgi:hypothetical protein
MRSFVGRILRGDDVLLEKAHVYLTVTEPSESRTGKWRGASVTPRLGNSSVLVRRSR